MPNSHVLALKWRPRNFVDMIGQEHVLPALINSLDQNRLHHAYLFTGTRGVGKTSVARILAKCLNCEKGVSSTPCNTCNNCKAIDQGNFIDLIEVDAASRTKVEDTRELLDNVQYVPTQGRFKIYLIDEVHMLSNHSFNALLKTLEEPPPYVKFLLATTDPQKLPVTILSRCLQFHLKHISTSALCAHFESILQQEKITYEKPAVQLLSEAAKGSVRDGLSLTDQAIAYCGGTLTTQGVRTMLGTIGQDSIIELINALIANDPERLLSLVDDLAQYTTDFFQALDSLLSAFHHIAVAQFAPATLENEPGLQTLAGQLSKESTQLYYQIALLGKRDLPLAVSPRAGFEMVLLRMLAFEPVRSEQIIASPTKDQTIIVKPSAPQKKAPLDLMNNWTKIVDQLQLSGMAKALATHCIVKGFDKKQVELLLCASHQSILNKKLEDRLRVALSDYLNTDISLRISIGESTQATPAEEQQQKQHVALENANSALANDTFVQQLVDMFGAKIQPDSVKATEN